MAVKQLIERIELTSSASSITFSSIPQDYAHLVLKSSARTQRAGSVIDVVKLEFNNSFANLSCIVLSGTGATAQSVSRTSRVGFATGADATANTFGNSSAYISNYTASKPKSFSADGVGENNSTTSFQGIFANLWNDNSAVTSIRLFTFSGDDFVSGSTFSLYGITRGGNGTVTTA